ncbi:hypothetical protein BJX66DRAFT_57306 [Aspergillus keveii]|uniref:Uncharacterized protein n=1 Tax=Aspergillus keveii TaxID=714993 RepID=A0ABR4GGX6_9EURO
MALLHHNIIPGSFNLGHTISAQVLFLGQYGKFRQYHGLYGLVTPVTLMLICPLVASSQLILTLLLCSSISLSSSFRSLLSCLLSCTLSISLYYSLSFPSNCSFGKNNVRLMIPDQRSSTSGQKCPPLDTSLILIQAPQLRIRLSVDTIPTFRAVNYTNRGRHLLSPRL